ncbi:hypothetical protein M758_UG309200 [Ceratodon purpureus]|nr:hypothetical protein M758_UG309200 [Ceratodon purpureus]
MWVSTISKGDCAIENLDGDTVEPGTMSQIPDLNELPTPEETRSSPAPTVRKRGPRKKKEPASGVPSTITVKALAIKVVKRRVAKAEVDARELDKSTSLYECGVTSAVPLDLGSVVDPVQSTKGPTRKYSQRKKKGSHPLEHQCHTVIEETSRGREHDPLNAVFQNNDSLGTVPVPTAEASVSEGHSSVLMTLLHSCMPCVSTLLMCVQKQNYQR